MFTLVDSILDSHQSAAQGSCWSMGNSDSVWLEKAGDCFGDVGMYGIACHMLSLAIVLPAGRFRRVFWMNELG